MTGVPVEGWSPSLGTNPRLSQWLEIRADGQVVVSSGKVELGQGILIALVQIAADELDVRVSRVRTSPATTGVSPDESYTSGSMSVPQSGGALRQVCAEARAMFLDAAAAELGVPAATIQVDDGDLVASDGRRTSYWQLAPRVSLDREVSGAVRPKPPEHYRTTDMAVPRPDLRDKLAGKPSFIHDMRLPGQLHGRVARPPSLAAQLLSLDDSEVRAIPDVVTVVRDGSFIGVVATREEIAVQGAEILRANAVWREKDSLPDETSLADYLLHAPATTTVLHEVTTDEATSVDESSVPETGARRTVNARFSRPYLAHASLAPSCGVALFEAGVLKVWSHSQGVYPLRRELSRQCALELEDVIVEHVPGAGCYGHNAADDAAYDAALLAQAVPGRPIQVVWSRPDELGWSPLAPAMVVDITATVDDAGAIQHWQHEIWSNGHTSRPGGPGFPPLLAATHQDPPAPGVVAADPPLARGGGSGRNALPAYDLPSVRVVSHLLAEMPLRTSAMRALGAHLNVYAIEQVIDDLALAVGADPLDYRLRLIRDPRAAEVVRLVAERSSWGTPPEGEAAGRGLGFARYKNAGAYCAVVADVDAESEVKVTRLTIAVDVGTAVNPAGVVNQIEGGALQAISWTVKEQVRFDRGRVTSTTWEDYPILTFSEVPPVDVVLVAPPGAAPLGAGEASVGPTAAAIGNAVHAALGVRVTRLPLVPANVVVAMR